MDIITFVSWQLMYAHGGGAVGQIYEAFLQGCGVDEFQATPAPTSTPAWKYRLRLKLRLRFYSGLTTVIPSYKKQYDEAIFFISILFVS